jgi:hypothetical protein
LSKQKLFRWRKKFYGVWLVTISIKMAPVSADATSLWGNSERVLRALEVQQEARLLDMEVEEAEGSQGMKVDWISVLAAIGIAAAVSSIWLLIWLQ